MACGPYADHFQLPLRQFDRWAMMILGFGGVGFMAYTPSPSAMIEWRPRTAG
jgi:hypothetical protein